MLFRAASFILAVVASSLSTVVVAQTNNQLNSTGFFQYVGDLPVKRSDTSATTIGNAIYIAGGCISNQICFKDFCGCDGITERIVAFDPTVKPVSAGFKELKPMPKPRYRHSAATVGGRLFLMGGRTLADDIINDVDVYNPATNEWVTIAPPTGSTFDLNSDHGVFVVNDTIYVGGGYGPFYANPIDTVVKLVPSFGVNGEVSLAWSAGASLPRRLGDFSTLTLPNGRVMLFGGFSDSNNGTYCRAQKNNMTYFFDPVTEKWTNGPSFKFFSADQATGVFKNRVYAFGGQDKDGDVVCPPNRDRAAGSAKSFDLATNTWFEEENLPERVFRFSATEWPAGDKAEVLYVFGGQRDWSEKIGGEFGGNEVISSIHVFSPSLLRRDNKSAGTAVTASGAAAIVAMAVAGAIMAF